MSPERIKLMVQTINHIIEHPSDWRQETWGLYSCGSSHCFGGWAIVIAGKVISGIESQPFELATQLFGLNSNEAEWLFAACRTFGELYSFAERYINWPDDNGEYIHSGRDRGGFDQMDYQRRDVNFGTSRSWHWSNQHIKAPNTFAKLTEDNNAYNEQQSLNRTKREGVKIQITELVPSSMDAAIEKRYAHSLPQGWIEIRRLYAIKDWEKYLDIVDENLSTHKVLVALKKDW